MNEATPQPTANVLHHKRPAVLVSVLTFNSFENTLQTLRSLQRQSYPSYHLQVIDNASTDGTGDRIARIFPKIDIKTQVSNLGYTGGSNVALEQALKEGYDFVLLCNHDIEVDENAIEFLVETAEAHKDAGFIGAVEVSASTGKTRAAGGKYQPWTSHISWLTSVTTTSSAQVCCVHGALVLFTKRALEIGLRMDERLFMYMDEVDLGIKLSEKNLRAYTDQRVLFKHKSEPYKLDEEVGYLSQRNRLYINQKYGRWYQRLFYYCYVVLLELPGKMLVRSLQGHPRFALACLRGFVDGMRGRMGPPPRLR